ncbi:MAG: oxidoreductase domain protein [Paenibacillus sp.]|uniref:Gfo/Idh/MocA family protein n=1 Tax=Paenibacillus sp. GCM10012303 TaxID=3317340 RepID=UPI0029F27342|nr:oxidoreductase domain protein [Paenibacillus sp.]
MTTIRIGMIGTGNIAHSHATRLKKAQEAAIVALADPSAGSRKALKEKFALDGADEYDDYSEMLKRSDIDAVIICSPHTLHFEQAWDALSAGKHVLLEKPMVCTSNEAEELIAHAKETGKLLQVSYQRHCAPHFMYIRSAIAAGQIGKLTSITATLYQDWKDAQTGTWRQNPALSGGGMLMDSGSHIIDVLLWTTGLTPESVVTQLSCQDSPVEIDTFTAIRFAEGPVAGLNIIGKAPKRSFLETYGFVGEDGGIFYDNGKITLRRNGEEPVTPELPAETTDPDRNFVAAILGREELLVPGEYALKVIQLTESIYQAAGYAPLVAAE